MHNIKSFKWWVNRSFGSEKALLFVGLNGLPDDFTQGALVLTLYEQPGYPGWVFSSGVAPATPVVPPPPPTCELPPLPPYPADMVWVPPGAWIPGGEIPYGYGYPPGFFPAGFLTPGCLPSGGERQTQYVYGAKFTAKKTGFVKLALSGEDTQKLEQQRYQIFLSYVPSDTTQPTRLIANGDMYIETPGY